MMTIQVIYHFAIFIVFRLLHLLLIFESDVYALILRLFDGKSKQDDAEILNIFARFRFDPTDATRESDFLSFHDRTGTFDDICEEGWFIYSISERYVYLVKVEPVEEGFYESSISIEKCSKFSKYLFEHADKLARIELETFEKVTKNLPQFACKVVMIHSAPCGGGTVAAKLLQSCDNSKLSLLVIGEPPFLTSLSVLSNSLNIEEMRSLCKSTLLFSMIHQKPNQTIVLKARPSCTKLVPYINAGCPSIQHVFIAKQTYSDVVSRLVLYTSTHLQIFSLTCWMLNHSKYLVDSLTSWRLLEEEMMTRVGPKTDVEFSIAQVYGSIINYQRNRHYFALDPLIIDDLISDTANQVRPLLNICDVSDLAIPECIDWKRRAEDVLRNVWDTVELTKEDSERVAHLVELIQQDCYVP